MLKIFQTSKNIVQISNIVDQPFKQIYLALKPLVLKLKKES